MNGHPQIVITPTEEIPKLKLSPNSSQNQ